MNVCMLLHKSVVHDSRVRREAATLAAAGHEVTVVELAGPVPADDGDDGFRRCSALPPAWVRRVLPFATYRLVFLATFVARGRALRPEVVHAHDAAMLLPGALLARLTGARLVYDSHELATGVAYRSGAWQRLVQALEAALVPRCAAVITVSDGIADRLHARHRLRARPVVVRNVCDLPAPPRADGTRLRARLGLTADDPVVLHQGSAVPGRGCETLIRAVAAMHGVHLVLLGAADDPNAGELVALAQSQRASDRVHVLASVELDELLAHTAEADVGVSLLADSCENHRLALPNKVFEYVAAGVPVVTSALPELERLVQRHAIGWTADPADAVDVRRALSLALAARGDDGLRRRVATAARELRWPVERQRLLTVYEQLQRGERERVRHAYRMYRADERKRRAWDARRPGNVMLRATLLERLLEVTAPQRAVGSRLLDVGCGGGWWLAQLAQAGVPAERLHGVDLIADRVERARASVPGAQVDVADATALPFEDACFGVVLLLTTLSSAGSVGRSRGILLEARRVLAPGGVLVVYEPRVPNLRNRHTRRIPRGELQTCGGDDVVHESATLLPAIARRLGERSRRLERLPALRSHRLTIIRAAR